MQNLQKTMNAIEIYHVNVRLNKEMKSQRSMIKNLIKILNKIPPNRGLVWYENSLKIV